MEICGTQGGVCGLIPTKFDIVSCLRMGSFASSLGKFALGATLAIGSCVTERHEVDTDAGACTNPKLVIMADDVALSVQLALLDMEIIDLGSLTKPINGDFVSDDGVRFENLSMLVGVSHGYLCQKKAKDNIYCSVGKIGDLKAEPIPVTELRTVTWKDHTVSIASPITQQHPSGVEWISVSDTTCGAKSRFGTSTLWCGGQFSEEQLAVDAGREAVCVKDFKLSRDKIRARYEAYLKRLAK